MKRLIVCCDGTWAREDDSQNRSPSNVTLISRAIRQYAEKDNTPQIVYYQKGVGSSLDILEYLPLTTLLIPSKDRGKSPIEAAFGIGLEEDVRAGYGFLAHNYDQDPNSEDEIYLFGWSRGAYTARSIAGLISKFGLLNKRGMDGIADVYDAYRKGCFLDDASADLADIGAKLIDKYKPGTPRIRCVGVWDTVGSLGIPDVDILGLNLPFKNIFSSENQKYQFHNTNLHPNIDYAFHAIALNEQRTPFTPTLWNQTPDNTKSTLRQVWFVGTHTSVGGTDPDHDLSNIALTWMIQRVVEVTSLEFDEEYLTESGATIALTTRNKPWGCADYPPSDTGIVKLAGTTERTPNKYGANSNEKVHQSVQARLNWSATQPKPWSCPNLGGLDWEKPLGDLEREIKMGFPPVVTSNL